VETVKIVPILNPAEGSIGVHGKYGWIKTTSLYICNISVGLDGRSGYAVRKGPKEVAD
jgi:hypothetical protein